MTREELRTLWDAWQTAKDRYDRWSMSSVAGVAADARFEIDLQCRRAMRDMMAAEDAYTKAEREML